MYFIFPVIVIVLVLVLLQCLSCSFGQNQKVNIADMHYDYDNDKKQDTKSVLQPSCVRSPWAISSKILLQLCEPRLAVKNVYYITSAPSRSTTEVPLLYYCCYGWMGSRGVKAKRAPLTSLASSLGTCLSWQMGGSCSDLFSVIVQAALMGGARAARAATISMYLSQSRQ